MRCYNHVEGIIIQVTMGPGAKGLRRMTTLMGPQWDFSITGGQTGEGEPAGHCAAEKGGM